MRYKPERALTQNGQKGDLMNKVEMRYKPERALTLWASASTLSMTVLW